MIMHLIISVNLLLWFHDIVRPTHEIQQDMDPIIKGKGGVWSDYHLPCNYQKQLVLQVSSFSFFAFPLDRYAIWECDEHSSIFYCSGVVEIRAIGEESVSKEEILGQDLQRGDTNAAKTEVTITVRGWEVEVGEERGWKKT